MVCYFHYITSRNNTNIHARTSLTSLTNFHSHQWLSPMLSSLLPSPFTVVGFPIRAPFLFSLFPPTPSSAPQPPSPGTSENSSSSSPYFPFLVSSWDRSDLLESIITMLSVIPLRFESSLVWIDELRRKWWNENVTHVRWGWN